MKIPALLLACGALCFTSAVAHAQERVNEGDLKCLLTMGALGSSEKNRIPALMGVYYFAGRIHARSPDYPFGKSLQALATTMKPKDYQEAAKTCGDEVNRTTQALQAAQADMKGPGGK